MIKVYLIILKLVLEISIGSNCCIQFLNFCQRSGIKGLKTIEKLRAIRI
jgi:hypothetical protein